MTEITLELPNSLADKIKPLGVWMPTIIELSLVGFRYPMTAGASSDLIRFLSRNPTPQEVLNYNISDELQERVGYLLDLNREDEISEQERQELDEWMKFDHIAILLSAQAGKLVKEKV